MLIEAQTKLIVILLYLDMNTGWDVTRLSMNSHTDTKVLNSSEMIEIHINISVAKQCAMMYGKLILM